MALPMAVNYSKITFFSFSFLVVYFPFALSYTTTVFGAICSKAFGLKDFLKTQGAFFNITFCT
jgi:hypothetical protein